MKINWEKLVEKDLLENHETRDYSKFRVSDAGYCHRMRFWKRKGFRLDLVNEFNLQSQKIFKIGHFVHNYIQELLVKQGLVKPENIERRVEVEDIIGHIDFFSNDGFVYDIKTAGVRKFQQKKKTRETDRHHKLQVLTYAFLLETQGEKVKGCCVLYVSKDTFEFLDLPVEKNYEIVEYDWKKLLLYWENNELPPPQPQEEWQCRYCPYQKVCEGGNSDEEK